MIVIQPPKNVLIDYVEVNTKQRILKVKPERIDKLAESLKEVGRILTPLLVTINGVDTYQLVAGATRLEAAKQLKWVEVPICVISGNADELKQVEIEENLGRHDLTEAERETLEHARKMCRANIDAAVAEAKAYAAAHPKEVAAELAEAKRAGLAAGAALARRETKMTAGGERPKRKHRATGRKSVAAIAREKAAKPNTVQKRIRRERAKKDSGKMSSKAPREVTPGKQGLMIPGRSGKKLEPAEKVILELTLRVDVILDHDTTWERIDDVIPVAGKLHPKARAKLVRALHGVAKRATRLADKLEGVEQAETRSCADGNGVDAEASAAARKPAHADDEAQGQVPNDPTTGPFAIPPLLDRRVRADDAPSDTATQVTQPPKNANQNMKGK